jgi:N-acetylneuraminate lyase
MPPVYFKPADTEMLVRWCGEIASAAPGIPFYYYHIPSMTGVTLPVLDLLKQSEGRIPGMAGAKFTHENIMDLQQCIAYNNGRFRIFFGRDEILLSGLAAGVTSGIGSTYNFAAPLYYGIIEAFRRGDMETARELQGKAQSFIRIMTAYGGGVLAGTAMMKMIGLDCGPVRLPQKALTTEEERNLKNDLKQTGFFNLINPSTLPLT